ncbi:Uncharacterised protein [Mycobacterium tuberculosis]|uniref:Uncharacterized protein n=1 Tax=Mycobacterium tuberculosis TaxID=1773 RepID=A0A655JK60_MYCTX|nr:Uncharacterised protein [Mycobacterium tuberculosis]CKS27334.1 Uncharacterised protein [Mycobacterium tuberculosis]CKT79217.1 Uncharacterised protein [Mycobacterium tuberculosis]CKV02342.1 Uncharacterised protein [Mycobacterium tuberculosis]CNM76366.1 Uncharacterised protein [Mycobacterium tuberculosis]
MTDSSTDGPPAASHCANTAQACSSVTRGVHRSGTCDWPGRRPRSNRDNPPLTSSNVGAHHATTCDCARVSAT